MYKVIPNNHLSVKLHEASYPVLRSYVESNPAQNPVALTSLSCSILFANDPLPKLALSNEIYEATITGASVWYDSYTNSRSLVVTLDSPAIEARRDTLMDRYSIQSVYPVGTPLHLTLQYGVIPNHRKFRWFYNEVFNTFNERMKGTVIQLQGESVNSSSMWVKSDLETQDSANSDANDVSQIVNLKPIPTL